MDHDKIVLAHSHLNPFGVWTIGFSSACDDDFASIGWLKPKGSRMFGGESRVGFERHDLYYGLNATKWIEIAPEDIEDNVAVDIVQAGNEFWIHFISFDDAEPPQGEKLDALLQKAVW